MVLKVFLKPKTEPKYPGNKTAALVVFARTGGMPMKRRAGSVMKLPPPAREFKIPAIKAAKQASSKKSISKILQSFYNY